MIQIMAMLRQMMGRKEERYPAEEERLLLEDIQEVCQKIQRANFLFDSASDGDLVDASIYELESLYARHRFLLRRAREMGLTCSPVQAKLLRAGGEA